MSLLPEQPSPFRPENKLDTEKPLAGFLPTLPEGSYWLDRGLGYHSEGRTGQFVFVHRFDTRGDYITGMTAEGMPNLRVYEAMTPEPTPTSGTGSMLVSDTPRTDEARKIWDECSSTGTLSMMAQAHAERLERELAAAKAELAEKSEKLHSTRADLKTIHDWNEANDPPHEGEFWEHYGTALELLRNRYEKSEIATMIAGQLAQASRLAGALKQALPMVAAYLAIAQRSERGDNPMAFSSDWKGESERTEADLKEFKEALAAYEGRKGR